ALGSLTRVRDLVALGRPGRLLAVAALLPATAAVGVQEHQRVAAESVDETESVLVDDLRAVGRPARILATVRDACARQLNLVGTVGIADEDLLRRIGQFGAVGRPGRV